VIGDALGLGAIEILPVVFLHRVHRIAERHPSREIRDRSFKPERDVPVLHAEPASNWIDALAATPAVQVAAREDAAMSEHVDFHLLAATLSPVVAPVAARFKLCAEFVELLGHQLPQPGVKLSAHHPEFVLDRRQPQSPLVGQRRPHRRQQSLGMGQQLAYKLVAGHASSSFRCLATSEYPDAWPRTTPRRGFLAAVT